MSVVLLAAFASAGCTPSSQTTPTEQKGRAQVAPLPDAVAPTSAHEDAKKRCGALACEEFATPEAAFERVLAQKPRVLAVGETHAQKDLDGGVSGVTSSTKRFTDTFIPLLAGRATDLVIELWVANGSCGKRERAVAAAQKPVTETQAPTNQNEFMVLGDVAKRRGIHPHALVPSCDEYGRILDAGGGDVDAMLSMIARLTARDLDVLLTGRARADAGPDAMLVAYGGAMHNDLAPRPGHEAWSFGPAMAKSTDGHYVELDLIVPEAIKDTDVWRALPWYPHFDAAAHRDRTLLITVAPASYVLVFSRAKTDASGALSEKKGDGG